MTIQPLRSKNELNCLKFRKLQEYTVFIIGMMALAVLVMIGTLFKNLKERQHEF
jgi:hypothetical protein